jgi:hypothetical protein
VVALGVLRHRPAAGRAPAPGRGAATATRLPVGATFQPGALPLTGGEGQAIAGSGRVVVHEPDPRGGLPWGMRMFATTRGETCIQVGRVQDGALGVIGIDGAVHDDGRFHALALNDAMNAKCSQTDGHGHAFDNVGSLIVAANGVTVDMASGSCRVGADGPRLAPCPAGDVRRLDFGLLGPEAAR